MKRGGDAAPGQPPPKRPAAAAAAAPGADERVNSLFSFDSNQYLATLTGPGGADPGAAARLRIWHVGNWCIHTGTRYYESPFAGPSKDVWIHNYSQPFVDALRAIPGAAVISQPSWELYHMSQEQFEERLRWATTLILGDTETKCLMLHPNFFTPSLWEATDASGKKRDLEKDPIRFPDRFDQIKEWVRAGGHLHMNGGWYSFSGERGAGGWGRSRLAEVFPVNCLGGDRPVDDLIESTDGYQVRCALPAHAMSKGVNWSSAPPLLGFNETELKPGAEAVVEVFDPNRGKWHPLLAHHRFGRGRSSTFATTPTPHWGINFQRWREYNAFWRGVFDPAE
eukprot:TRINITY_DN2153_c3_g1_i1.p1 TRINITY_DN2153_c3_g1~~TRINITY_DN2153_c3_g1_i1.p1  ORF type:complete len:338 (+),score=113.75 TRINITY_DN2153_c3_g1_i1:71-1084(+)